MQLCGIEYTGKEKVIIVHYSFLGAGSICGSDTLFRSHWPHRPSKKVKEDDVKGPWISSISDCLWAQACSFSSFYRNPATRQHPGLGAAERQTQHLLARSWEQFPGCSYLIWWSLSVDFSKNSSINKHRNSLFIFLTGQICFLRTQDFQKFY